MSESTSCTSHLHGRSFQQAQQWGSSDGIPVLLCASAATSRWLGFGGVVEALGVRLVSVDRPGLGVSTPAPGRTSSYFAGDMRQLCALRGLENPAVVANSQGAPFAVACAEAGVAPAMAVVSGTDEVATPQFASVLPADLRGLVERARPTRTAPRSSSPASPPRPMTPAIHPTAEHSSSPA